MENKIHTIDGEEYKECSYTEWSNLPFSQQGMIEVRFSELTIYLRKVKKKIEFPVRVELNVGYCHIYKDKSIGTFYYSDEEKAYLDYSDLQKINEKMKELEEQGAFE